ncbi:unnamed protein product [Heligmosomoides polygyrus]|uniref:GON7 subunit of KEOPS complex n=1 Tax=Heligmosomoides polygyrus TaxID=6339 RepID=A0A183GMS8_HELPZ|nr:unnamed protein product [Heligmosomoides polygyrus]
MKILGSKQIMDMALLDTAEDESGLSKRYAGLTDQLLQAIDKHLPGAEETETESEEECSDEDSEEDEQMSLDKKLL